MEILYWLLPVAVAVIIFLIVRKKKTQSEEKFFDKAPFYKSFPLPLPFEYVTPMGVAVGTQKEFGAEKDKTLAAIDAGISDYLLSTEGLGFTDYRKHSDFTIALLSDFVPSLDGNPAIRLKMQSAWKGTEFDRGDGSMLVAGLMYQGIIYFAQSENHEFSRVISRFEAEHFGDKTKIGIHAHPLFPLPVAALLAGRARTIKVNCGGVIK